MEIFGQMNAWHRHVIKESENYRKEIHHKHSTHEDVKVPEPARFVISVTTDGQVKVDGHDTLSSQQARQLARAIDQAAFYVENANFTPIVIGASLS